MGTHATHNMHENSMAAWRQLDLGDRNRRICGILERYGACTDREVCCRMGHSDMNYVRPRITELLKKEVVIGCGTVKCDITERSVRLVRLAKEGEAA